MILGKKWAWGLEMVALLVLLVLLTVVAVACSRTGETTTSYVAEPLVPAAPASSTTTATADAFVHPFPRTGAHANLACPDCHVSKPGAEIIPGTQLPRPDPACSSCHGDQHAGLTDCASCHTPTAWTDLTFQHPFPRTGAHAGLTCADCHVSKPGGTTVSGTQFPAADPACTSCHGDQHGGLTDCASCHTPTAWTDLTFQHPFPRTGAHASLACADCHGTPFAKVSPACVSCHGAKHGGLTKCASCHTTKAWKPSTFKHPFSLTGGHAGLACSACHGKTFAKVSTACVSCHGAKHGGLTKCASCHTTKAWKPSTFRHPGAGEHSAGSFACVKCHPSGYATHSCTCHGGNPPTDD